LVSLQTQHVVTFLLDNLLGYFFLATHCINRHYGTGNIQEFIEKPTEIVAIGLTGQ